MSNTFHYPRIVSIKLDADLDRQVNELAKAKGVTRSQVVREALAVYAARGSARSVLAVAGDLVGSASGARDLSSNPKHLKGFGR